MLDASRLTFELLAGDTRVEKLVRPLLKSRNGTFALTTIKALSGAIVRMDPSQQCYLPTRDELDNDDLKIKDAAKLQHKHATENIKFLKGMHKFLTSPDMATRQCALDAISPLLAHGWPETLDAYLEGLEDENEVTRLSCAKQLRRLGAELPQTFIGVLLERMNKDVCIAVRLVSAECLEWFASRADVAHEFVLATCNQDQDQVCASLSVCC